MNGNFVVGLGQEVIFIVLELTGPILLIGMLVGLIISIFQATTQIQEQTLTFVPKIAAAIVILFLAGPWMLGTLTHFTSNILGNLQRYIQ